MTLPWNRKRVSPSISATSALHVRQTGPFSYHMGDVLTPGASVFAIDMPRPGLMPFSAFGRGGVASVCCRKYTFDFRAPQAINIPTLTTVNPSAGGLYTGTFALTSLIPDKQSAAL